MARWTPEQLAEYVARRQKQIIEDPPPRCRAGKQIAGEVS